MKILKEKSREYNGKSYFKFKINIPAEILNVAEFKEGDELDIEVKKGEVRLRKNG